MKVCQNVHVEAKGNFVGVGVLLPPLGARDGTLEVKSLSAESSHWPC